MSNIKTLKKELEKYLLKIEENYRFFKTGIDIYLEFGMTKEAVENLDRVHDTEEEADTIRREIIRSLLEGNFLATTREEFLRIVEMADKVADKGQSIVNNTLIKNVNGDKINIYIIKNILSITESQVVRLKEAVAALFIDYDKAFDIARSLEIQEREVDTLLKVFIQEIMATDMELTKKMYYRDFVNNIAKISDIIEDIGDEIEKIAVIRRV